MCRVCEKPRHFDRKLICVGRVNEYAATPNAPGSALLFKAITGVPKAWILLPSVRSPPVWKG
jgi:hypothetical protein